jgi:hypothetical protein
MPVLDVHGGDSQCEIEIGFGAFRRTESDRLTVKDTRDCHCPTFEPRTGRWREEEAFLPSSAGRSPIGSGRQFGWGYSEREIAETLGVTERTVQGPECGIDGPTKRDTPTLR